jgi:leucyl-tRNA synthetase
LTSEQARKKLTQWLEKEKIGRGTINYKMRDWLVSRQRYWGAPIPIIYCPNSDCHSRESGNPDSGSRVKPGMTECSKTVIDGKEYSMVAVPEKDLPVELPTDVDFMPTGESPLKKSKTFHDVKCPVCGKKAFRESDTMDTFVCSSWYYFRYPSTHSARSGQAAFDPELTRKWLPVDLYVGGAEHTVLHLLYSRFFTKVLHKLGYIDFDEPFAKLRHQGIILAEDGRKMSKSLGNVITPDSVVEQYGADALRMFEMFMGPLEDAKPWNTKGIIGISRFLERIWKLKPQITSSKSQTNHKAQNSKSKNKKEVILSEAKNLEPLLHKTIKKASEDIENLKFNTAISAMMILVNESNGGANMSKEQYEIFLKILSPFAPHMAEELWSQLDRPSTALRAAKSIFAEKWPEYDKNLIKEETIELVVQINGKVRGKFSVPADISEDEAIKMASCDDAIKKWLGGKEPKKVIFVKGRLVNIVV